MSDQRVLFVGWDAADWKMIHPLMDRGLMPTVKGLVERGVMGNLTTLSPVLSPMLWTSIATGKRPFKHGVLGFTEPTPDGRAVQPISGLSRRTKALWNILNQEGRRSIVVGWWPSHPAEPLNGVMVSNRFHQVHRTTDPRWPLPEGAVHPATMAAELAELRFHPLELTEAHLRPFVPRAELVDQSTDRRLDTCLKIIAECTTVHACATELIEHERWDFAAVYYDAIDHFGHAFMKYHPPRQSFVSEHDFDIYQHVVTAAYIYHDMMLARLVELAGPETTVVLVSDHGFHPDHLRPSGMPVEPAGPAIEHRDLGVFVMAGPGIRSDHLISGATLLDVAPTLLAHLGLPIGEDMDGRPLLDAFDRRPEVRRIPSWDDVPGEDGRHPPDHRLEPSESREALEHLVALGYIERPDADAGKAVANTVRELRYNEALAYIDAAMHPKAAEILAELYRDHPLEFRFGIRLAICLQAMQQVDATATVIDHLDANWRRAAEAARARLSEVADIARERRRERRRTNEAPAASGDASAASRPRLFSDAERRVVRQLRGIARGNPRTIDYLAASLAMTRKDYDAALAHLERARKVESETPGLYLQIGTAFLELQRLDDAEQSFRRVLELDPEHPAAFVGLCRVALRRRRTAEALAAGRAAVGLKFHSPPAHFYLAIAQHRAGEPEEAIASLRRALSQNPNFPEAHARLAMIYSRSRRDPKQAIAHRALAQAIRQERRRRARARPAIALPPLQAIDVEASLPTLPEPTASGLKPPLAAPPAAARSADDRPFVTIVSGLPRSGTSMMMQMLVAGGLEALADDRRAADADNPRGYLELEKVKRLAMHNDWLDEARGRALKVVAPLLGHLPQDCAYRVLMMERELDEVVASQAAMLERLGREGARLDAVQLRAVLARQLEQAAAALDAHRVPVLRIGYAETLSDPAGTAARVADFLGMRLAHVPMVAAIDAGLRRAGGR